MPEQARQGWVPHRQRRAWLWVSAGALCLLALLVGMIFRTSTHGGGTAMLMAAVATAAAALFLAGEIVTVLQVVQAREATRTALASLPPGHRVSGRIRVRGAGRPVVVDHLVVRPDGIAFAVTIDGSTNPPRPGDTTDGLSRLLAQARRAAEVVQRAADAGVLPPELGLRSRIRVQPCILAARRPLRTGPREGVLACAAADAAHALGGPHNGASVRL